MIQQLQDLLQITFNNPNFIHRSLSHSSYVNEVGKSKLDSNERLEFLGDAVLELLVSDFLYKTYPQLPEGQLTTMRAQLVQEASLAYLSRQIGLDRALKLGRGEELQGGRHKDSVIADAYEAVLAAIYLDQGMAVAQQFVTKTLLDQHQVMLKTVNVDYKTQLQERVQKRGAVNVKYALIGQSGPAHNLRFNVQVSLDDQVLATGEGTSKKAAEMMAAKNALDKVDDQGFIKK